MLGQFGQISFVVWRESVEALLIIGILNAWLTQQGGDVAKRGRFFLGMGAIAGCLIAILFAYIILAFSQTLSEETFEYFQIGMVFMAAILILQMVVWLRRHGRGLKKNLEKHASRFAEQAQWGGIFLLTMLAIVREGSETVIFLYGIIASHSAINVWGLITAIVVGLACALFTYYLIQLGQRYISWKTFFRMTELMLLFLGASLLINGIDHLFSLGIIEDGGPILWDSSAIIDDTSVVGNLLAGLTGYRARPDVVWLVSYGCYWLFVMVLLRVTNRSPRPNL